MIAVKTTEHSAAALVSGVGRSLCVLVRTYFFTEVASAAPGASRRSDRDILRYVGPNGERLAQAIDDLG